MDANARPVRTGEMRCQYKGTGCTRAKDFRMAKGLATKKARDARFRGAQEGVRCDGRCIGDPEYNNFNELPLSKH